MSLESAVWRDDTPVLKGWDKVAWAVAEPLPKPLWAQANAAEAPALGARGRVVSRVSGTEPVIRVMAEAEDEALVDGVVSRLADLIQAEAQAA